MDINEDKISKMNLLFTIINNRNKKLIVQSNHFGVKQLMYSSQDYFLTLFGVTEQYMYLYYDKPIIITRKLDKIFLNEQEILPLTSKSIDIDDLTINYAFNEVNIIFEIYDKQEKGHELYLLKNV
jgi:hypothetical protein